MEISGKDLEHVSAALACWQREHSGIITPFDEIGYKLGHRVGLALIKERAEAVTKRKEAVVKIVDSALITAFGKLPAFRTPWTSETYAFYEAVIDGAKERGLV